MVRTRFNRLRKVTMNIQVSYKVGSFLTETVSFSIKSLLAPWS